MFEIWLFIDKYMERTHNFEKLDIAFAKIWNNNTSKTKITVKEIYNICFYKLHSLSLKDIS